MTALLEMKNISHRFHSNEVLRKVNFQLNPAEVHALMGENGAGKSTLMKILTSIHHLQAGTITHKGKLVNDFGSPYHSLQAGISMIHQELSVAPGMTVQENIFMGSELHHSGILSRRLMIKKTKELLESLGASFQPQTPCSLLNVAQRQLVEIARALHYGGEILIMDEPTASLSDLEAENILSIINKLRTDGKGIIYISHRIKEIKQIADRVTVLRDGQNAGEIHGEEIAEGKIIKLMVGRNIDDYYIREEARSHEKPILEISHLSGTKVNNCSLKIFQGEVLGMAGLVGAGRSELFRFLFGIDQADSGEIFLHGKKIHIDSPRSAMNMKIAYVPEDRKTQGLFLDMSTLKNIVINQPTPSSLGISSRKTEEKTTQDYIEKFDIRLDRKEQPVSFLSGGNQQKVLIARWASMTPEILILDEPTKGVDVGAKREIYGIINDMRKKGTAVVIISSELPEIIAMSHRILVMCRGEIHGELTNTEDFTEEKVMTYATGMDHNYTYQASQANHIKEKPSNDKD